MLTLVFFSRIYTIYEQRRERVAVGARSCCATATYDSSRRTVIHARFEHIHWEDFQSRFAPRQGGGGHTQHNENGSFGNIFVEKVASRRIARRIQYALPAAEKLRFRKSSDGGGVLSCELPGIRCYLGHHVVSPPNSSQWPSPFS